MEKMYFNTDVENKLKELEVDFSTRVDEITDLVKACLMFPSADSLKGTDLESDSSALLEDIEWDLECKKSMYDFMLASEHANKYLLLLASIS